MNTTIKATTSKAHVAFWSDRLFKRRENPDWHVRIGCGGHQERIPLRTPNKEAAATKALKLYESLRANGWDATREKFTDIWAPKYQRIESPAVGEYLAAVEQHGGINPVTFKSYSRKFRRLVSAVAGIKGDESRFYRGAGSEKWRADIDAVKMARLTPAAITKWKDDYVVDKRGNALKQNRAKTTVQSVLRNSMALFSARVLRRLAEAKIDLQLPDPLPFAGVEIGPPPSHRYSSSIDANKLAQDANNDLAKAEPEHFKIFLLAFGVGLRRGEIDRLTWPQFNWSKNQINVVVTEHGAAKTQSSLAPVDVDPAIMRIFKKFKAKATGEFVVESSVQPRPDANWHHYRCECTFKRFLTWLRGKGVNTPNPIHTLRKEFGTLICQQFGIFAASEALRHSDIRLTRNHYVEKRGRIHLEVGKMLKGGA